MNSPIPWFGGKGMMTKKLLPFIPPHATYVEPFGGGASLLFAKEPSKVEVYNDLNSGLVTMFRVMRDPEQFKLFHEMCMLTPYSREEYKWCAKNWQYIADPVKRAWAFYLVAKWSFGGNFGSFMTVAGSGKIGSGLKSWINSIDRLPIINKRLLSVIVEQRKALDAIRYYDRKDTFFYLDPPYVKDTRRSGGYEFEMASTDHKDFIDAVLSINGMAVISGYQHPIYDKLIANSWKRLEWDVICNCGKKSTESAKRTESLWLCPKTQKMLKLKELINKGTGKTNGNLKKETIDKIKKETTGKGVKGNSRPTT